MPLSPARIEIEGQTAFDWERDAITFIKKALPDNAPYRLWALVDLPDNTGRIHQIDALILGYHALYVVEVKSWPGRLDGDNQHWKVTFPGGRSNVYDNPIGLTNQKAKILASMLEKRISRPELRPWVEPIVFLSDPTLVVNLPESARAGVVTPANFVKAITFGEVPSAGDRLRRRTVNKPAAEALVDAMRKVGLVPSKADLRLGDFRLTTVIEDGPGFQDWGAEHETSKGMRRRVRLYIEPPSASIERREQIRRAADREAKLLTALDHPSILRVHDYRFEGPKGGPAVAFEDLEGAQTLESFVRTEGAALSFADRTSIIERLAEAIHYCHGKSIYHRGLHPGSALVRRRPDGKLEVKLYNFQLAMQEDATLGTVNLGAFTSDTALLYRAPEAFENPEQAGTEGAEIFSLGAIAYFVLTGQHPGGTVPGRHKLLEAGGLSVAAASDAFVAGATSEDRERIKSLDEVVRLATLASPEGRADDLMTWLALFLEAATPKVEEEQVDPLEAGPGAHLAVGPDEEGFEVIRVLGSGSTAKVLLVRRGDSQYALKVALGKDLEDRIDAEADALARVQSDRIVRLEERLILGGRSCLLLTHAGETLAHVLASEGPVGLDYARRWGEDLLSALGTLEERGVLHKDVKPANLGVLSGEAKKTRHLFLFDFSLAAADPSRIDAGTPAYRDPFIQARGRWDEACDRWAAALTLHEMLAGVLPRFEGGAAIAPGAEVVIAAERFDPSVRGALLAFFQKAFQRDAAKRHASAEEMRTHWLTCFGPSVEKVADGRPEISDDALAALAPTASIEALPLTAAAKNTLDRSGIVTLRELLEVPRNELSGIRGAGRATVREIRDLIERYGKLRTLEPASAAPFYPAYRGRDGRVAEVSGLPAEVVGVLGDAGLGRFFAIAAARKERIERLLADHAGAAATLRSFLDLESKAATDVPQTIEGFVEVLLPARKKSKQVEQVRLFYGLDVREGVAPDDAKSVADALKVDRVAVYVAQNRLRAKWSEDGAKLTPLSGHALAAVQSLGGAAPLEQAAAALPTWLPHEPGQSEGELSRRRSEALLRIMAQVGPEGRPVLAVERIHDKPWVGISRGALAAAKALGEVADELATQDPIPSADLVRERLEEQTTGTDLAQLPQERLVAIAALASRRAATSARLELYPRGMPAERALKYAAGVLGSGLTPEEVLRAVAARYPEAGRLPDRPDLDALLVELRLRFDATTGKYVRIDLPGKGTKTEALPRGHTTTFSRALQVPRTEAEIIAAQFERQLQSAKLARVFRVLDVNRAHAEDAADRLARRGEGTVVSLEKALLDRTRALVEEKGIDPQVVLKADREGPGSPDFEQLTKLMNMAAAEVATDLLERTGLVVLTHPGMLARYDLGAFVQELVKAKDEDRGPAIFLVNPAQDGGGPQPILGVDRSLEPQVQPNHHYRIPREWLGPLGGPA